MKKRKKKISIKKNAFRILIFSLFSISIILVVFISVNGIVRQISEKKEEESSLIDKMADLEEKENDLNNEIKKLQDSDYLARYAREKYFYSKDGELIIRIPSDNE